jgi:hypothetical protein
MNFVQLAGTAIFVFADQHGQQLAAGIVPDSLMLLHSPA